MSAYDSMIEVLNKRGVGQEQLVDQNAAIMKAIMDNQKVAETCGDLVGIIHEIDAILAKPLPKRGQ